MRELVDKVRTKMLADGDWPASLAGSAIKSLIEKAVVAICQASAPYVGSGIEVANGLAKTIAAAKKFSMYSLRKKFELREGHPARTRAPSSTRWRWISGRASRTC